jgi:hypothetical protein
MKKNLRKVPTSIRARLKQSKDNEIVVGCAKIFSADDLKNGALRHLGVELTEQGLHYQKIVIPPETAGKYSDWNVNGKEIKRTDLPKEPYTISFESPNFGDWSNGSHTVEWTRERYPIDFHPPKQLTITIACGNTKPGLGKYALVFRVEEVLNRSSGEFEDALLFDLNLLQENIGTCGIERADVRLQEYLKTLHVSWEVLPPGTQDEVVKRVFNGRQPSSEDHDVAVERYKYFMSLNPKQLIFGSSGLQRYFGALLEDDLVVFENIRYGNAVYILYEKWKELSQRSRLELLSGRYGDGFDRVRHGKGWKDIVRNLIKDRRGK